MTKFLRADEIVSKSTQTTGRSLALISVTAIFAQLTSLQFSGIGVLNDIGATEGHLATATDLIIIFLMTSHHINWLVDWGALSGSEQEKEMRKLLFQALGDAAISYLRVLPWRIGIAHAQIATMIQEEQLNPKTYAHLPNLLVAGHSARRLLVYCTPWCRY